MKNFGAHVCRVTFKHLPQPLRSHIQSFGTLGQLLKIPPFSAHSAVGRGGSLNFVLVGIRLFLWVRSPCKISESYDNFWKYHPCPPKYMIFIVKLEVRGNVEDDLNIHIKWNFLTILDKIFINLRPKGVIKVLWYFKSYISLVLVCIIQSDPLGQIRRCVNCVICVIMDRLYLGIVDFPWSSGLSGTYGVLVIVCQHHNYSKHKQYSSKNKHCLYTAVYYYVLIVSDFAVICTNKIPLKSMRGQVTTLIGGSGNV